MALPHSFLEKCGSVSYRFRIGTAHTTLVLSKDLS